MSEGPNAKHLYFSFLTIGRIPFIYLNKMSYKCGVISTSKLT